MQMAVIPASRPKQRGAPKRFLFVICHQIHPSTISHVLSGLIAHTVSMPLTNAKIRELKAKAQLMKPTLKVGHDGLSAQFIAALDVALKQHELVKVKFTDHKEEQKTLSPQLAVLFRAKPAAEAKEEIVED